jgi:tetratricopeptide (TPR) repeat protein
MLQATSAIELAFRGLYVQPTLDLKEAIRQIVELCDAALRLNPTLPAALWCKARVAGFTLYGSDPQALGPMDSNRLAEMDALTSQAVAMDPSDANLLNARADALRVQHRFDAAVEARSRALQLNPALVETYAQAALDAIRMGAPQNALTLLKRQADIFPDVERTELHLIAKCRANVFLGLYDEAIASCEKASAGGVMGADEKILLAAAYAQKGEIAKAQAAKDGALRLRRNITIAYFKSRAIGQQSDTPAYDEKLERYFLPGLRKAGFPEK